LQRLQRALRVTLLDDGSGDPALFGSQHRITSIAGRISLPSQTTHDVVEFLIAQMSLFLALLLTASALHKVFQFERVRTAAAELVGLSRRLASAAVVGATLLEASAALLICITPMRSIGAGLAAVVFAAYLVSIVRAIGDDRRDVDCGCSFGTAHRRLGAFETLRNSTLLVEAIVVSIGSAASATSLGISDFLPAFVFMALYFAFDEVMAVQPIARKIHS